MKFGTQLSLLLTIGLRLAYAARGLRVDAVHRKEHYARSDLREPIITGCLAECGVADQSCATQCQVCVEKLECRGLEEEKCSSCRRDARKGRLASNDKDSLAIDSGGSSLVHEGIRARLEVAKLDALRHQRLLRKLQGGILKFQRQAEYAAEERLNERKVLHEAKLVLKHAEGEEANWELRSARKLKKSRSHARRLRNDLLKAEADVDEARDRLRAAKRLVHKTRLSSQRREALPPALKELETAKVEFRKARLIETQQRQVVEMTEAQLENEERDANWLEGGLKKKRDAAEDAVDEAVSQMQAARGMERLSRERLEKAKLRYRKAAVTEDKLNDQMMNLSTDLDKAPLQTSQDVPEIRVERKNTDADTKAQEDGKDTDK